MASHALEKELAETVVQNDPAAIAPLIKLLCRFRKAHSNPDGEQMMDEIIGSLYVKTDHCQESIQTFVSLAA